MSKQFYLKQFSLAKVRSLNVKTVLFPSIQFNISTQFSSSWSIDRNLSVVPLLTSVDQGAMVMKEYFAFPKALSLQEPHYQIV